MMSKVSCLCFVALSVMSPLVGAQPAFDRIVATSFELAGHIEHVRMLPPSVEVEGVAYTPSAWMEMGIHTVLAIDGQGNEIPRPGTWQMPGTVYPAVILQEAAYGEPLDRLDYLSFLQGLATSYASGATLPSTFVLRGDEVRFVDVVHLVASLLRFYAAYGYLPAVMDLKVATPLGLFNWGIPSGKEVWLSAFQNESGDPFSNTNEYYQTAVLDYPLYQVAHEVVQGISDPFAAGEHIYDWSNNRFQYAPYAVHSGPGLFGHVAESFEFMRNMRSTSGAPSRINRGLYVAAGLVHGYDQRGYGGTLFTEEQGWYNAEIHAGYGDPIEANPFFLLDGDPLPQDPNAAVLEAETPLFDAVAAVSSLDTTPPARRAFWINASDVAEHGAEALVEVARAGGFNTIVVTVKSFIGRLYFETGMNDVTGDDVLNALLAAAAPYPGVEVFAAFHTLGGYELDRADEWGQMYFEERGGYGYNHFLMSPCVPGFVGYLKRLIDALYGRYDVKGLVLAGNFVIYDAWANTECAMTGSTNDQEKEERIARFANDLAAHAKSINPDRTVWYLTAPLISVSGDDVGALPSRHDAAASHLAPDSFDGIILTFPGLAWLTEDESYPRPASETRDHYIATYDVSTELPVYTTVHLSKEWMYPPSFYRGLARLYRTKGVDGVFFTGRNSGEGEYGSAFVAQHYATLQRIRFDAPPPPSEVLTYTDHVSPTAPRFVFHAAYPNPATGPARFRLEQTSSGMVTLRAMDVLGRTVATLIDGWLSSGNHEVVWDPRALPAGVYFVHYQGPEGTATRSVVVH